ncbi:MAG: hypothetical protein ACK4NR_08850 [Micavibrio sp.]
MTAEAWKAPDGRQLTWQALNQMGRTPGDIQEIMMNVFRDRDPSAMQNMSLKGVALLGTMAEDSANDEFFEQKRQEDIRLTEEQRLEAERQHKQFLIDEKREQEQWQAKKDAEEKMAQEKRPQEDALNNRIMGLPFGLASFGMGLGLGAGALSSVGNILSPSLNAMSGPMMVAGNDGGGLLAMARQSLNVSAPQGQDIAVTGPNNAQRFTAGEPVVTPAATPTPAAPGVNNPFQQQPGLNGPSLMPPGF